MSKKIVFFSLLILIFVNAAFFINAQTVPGTGSGGAEAENFSIPYIDPLIIDKFENKTEVYVGVLLKDKSNLSYEGAGTPEERRQIYEQKAAYFLQAEEEVLSTLSEFEFKVTFKSRLINGFDGYITRAGLEKLRLNPNVIAIVADRMISVGLDESVEDNQTLNLNKCIKEKQELFGSMQGYVSGNFIVMFKENISLDDAITLLTSYNLSIYRNEFPKYIGVTVLIGTEIEEICLLEKNNFVKSGTLIPIGVAMELEEDIGGEIVVPICGNKICDEQEECIEQECISIVEKEFEVKEEVEMSLFEKFILFIKSLFGLK